MKEGTNLILERLQNMIESTSANELDWWDSAAILEENKPAKELKKERLQILKEQAVTTPIHKHNQITFTDEET
jgi:hypothetical protein